jgi:hypothetical protein
VRLSVRISETRVRTTSGVFLVFEETLLQKRMYWACALRLHTPSLPSCCKSISNSESHKLASVTLRRSPGPAGMLLRANITLSDVPARSRGHGDGVRHKPATPAAGRGIVRPPFDEALPEQGSAVRAALHWGTKAGETGAALRANGVTGCGDAGLAAGNGTGAAAGGEARMAARSSLGAGCISTAGEAPVACPGIGAGCVGIVGEAPVAACAGFGAGRIGP